MDIDFLLKKTIAFKNNSLISLAAVTAYFVDNLNRILQPTFTADKSPLNTKEVLLWLRSNSTQINDFFDSFPILWDVVSNPKDSLKTPVIFRNNERFYSLLSLHEYKSDDIKKSAVLMPHGRLPKMYLYEIGSGGYIYNPKLDLDISHNDFIAKAISYLVFGLYDANDLGRIFNKDFDKISDFIKNNNSVINKIRSYFTTQPKLLGGGADGVAFKINSSMVLKIFRDYHTFNELKIAQNRLHKNPELAKTEAMIYDVGILGNFDGQDLYYCILEKMKTVENFSGKLYKTLGNLINIIIDQISFSKESYWRSFKKLIHDPKNDNLIATKVKEYALNMESEIREDYPDAISIIEDYLKSDLNSTWLSSLIEEIIMKYLTSRTDLHLGNLGITNYGHFRYFDSAYKSHTSHFNPPKFKIETYT